jgi:hypothetical protein
MSMWTKFIWVSTGSIGGLLWSWRYIFDHLSDHQLLNSHPIKLGTTELYIFKESSQNYIQNWRPPLSSRIQAMKNVAAHDCSFWVLMLANRGIWFAVRGAIEVSHDFRYSRLHRWVTRVRGTVLAYRRDAMQVVDAPGASIDLCGGAASSVPDDTVMVSAPKLGKYDALSHFQWTLTDYTVPLLSLPPAFQSKLKILKPL